ncbi:DUF6745 domain-containing protein [Nostoc sp.]|uniref:DUF6745 domain-containing protein n=1 Tax=Nostoc sp. TaxID=1180 RepID=UPI002FFB45A8
MPRRTNDMRKHIITELSDEQEAMLPIYRDKWRSIQISTESIQQEKVAAVIKAAYAVSDYPEPEILFYSSPMTAIEKILAIGNFKTYLGRDIHSKFSKRVLDHLLHGIQQQLEQHLFIRLRNQIQHPEFPYYSTHSHPQVSYFPYTGTCLERQLITDLDKLKLEFTDISYFTSSLSRPAEWAIWSCMLDFCISVINLQHDKKKWNVIQDLMQYCDLIFQFEKVCIVCDRPCKLSFDAENLLHAEGEPALKFADGYSVYARHGRHPSEEYRERYYEEQDPDFV